MTVFRLFYVLPVLVPAGNHQNIKTAQLRPDVHSPNAEPEATDPQPTPLHSQT